MAHAALELSELRDAIRALLSAESDSQAVRRAIGNDPQVRAHIRAAMVELGWLGIAIPERFGGLGLGFAELGVLYEELGRHLTPAALMPTLLAAEALVQSGNHAQQSKWLPSIASGACSATLGLPPVHRAIAVAGFAKDIRITCTLPHVLDAANADLLLIPLTAATDEQAFAVLERGSEGIVIQARPTIDQTRVLCDVALTNARVSPEQLLRLPTTAWSDLLNHASVALACDSMGGASRILELTVEYMKTRVQFDRPIGSFQALKARAAHWKILLEAASALTGQAATVLASGDSERSVWASNAKFYACDTYAAIAGDAIQLHGGIGFTWEHDCHLFFKRAKLNQVLCGSSVEHKERVAELLFTQRELIEKAS